MVYAFNVYRSWPRANVWAEFCGIHRRTVLPAPTSWLDCGTLKLFPVFQGPLLEAEGGYGLSQAPEVRRPSHSGLA